MGERKTLQERLENLEKCKQTHEEKLEWNFEIEGLKTKVLFDITSTFRDLEEPRLKSKGSTSVLRLIVASPMALKAPSSNISS